MKDPLISVIIPIYNVEKYLKKCLDSILNQKYKHLEIILIDDGSTDSSGQIADNYANRDSRIQVFHQSNGGLSNARNHGLKVMHGDYVTFIDSDDYVSRDYISFMFNLIKRANFTVPLAICSLIDVYSDTGHKQNCGDHSYRILSGKQCIEMMCYHDLVDTCAYAKLGSKRLYHNFSFPEGKLFEDIGSTYQLFMSCDKVACGFEGKYYYVVRPNSIVTSSFNPQKLDLLEMTDKMARDVIHKYPDLKQATLRRQVYARFSTLNQTLHTHGVRQIQKKLITFIKANRNAILNNKKAPRRDKIAYQMLQFGLPIYRLAWSVYESHKEN